MIPAANAAAVTAATRQESDVVSPDPATETSAGDRESDVGRPNGEPARSTPSPTPGVQDAGPADGEADIGEPSAPDPFTDAHALGRLPQIPTAMARGELSFCQVRALTGVATPECEEELLGYARTVTVTELERFVRLWRTLSGADEEALERERHRHRRFSVVADAEGMYVVRGCCGRWTRRPTRSSRPTPGRRRRRSSGAATPWGCWPSGPWPPASGRAGRLAPTETTGPRPVHVDRIRGVGHPETVQMNRVGAPMEGWAVEKREPLRGTLQVVRPGIG